jgi:hypothetical protein
LTGVKSLLLQLAKVIAATTREEPEAKYGRRCKGDRIIQSDTKCLKESAISTDDPKPIAHSARAEEAKELRAKKETQLCQLRRTKPCWEEKIPEKKRKADNLKRSRRRHGENEGSHSKRK